MKLSRLLGITFMIESKQHIRAKELAELFEVSVRTIYRDVEILCEAGIPIFATTGPNGGFSFVDGYCFNSNAFDRSEMEKLILSVYQQAIKEKDHGSKDPLLLKMKKIIPKSEQERFERLLDKTKTDASSWWSNEQNDPPSETNLDIIQKSIYKLKKIMFDYQSNVDFTPKRVLQPYGLVHKEGAWYAVGYSEERKDLRTFHCDRMSHVIISEEDYTIPVDFDLEVYWERSTREFTRRSVAANITYNSNANAAGTMGNNNINLKYPVLLQSDRDLSKVLAGFTIVEKEISSFKNSRNSSACHMSFPTSGYEYKVDLISERTALNLIFLQLGEIKIIEPLDLREKVILMAEKIIKKQSSK
jgi:predicted DNA-binding transcriptional regulator YafY